MMQRQYVLENSDGVWKEKLTPEEYAICRLKQTEPPFSGKYYNCKDKGIYKCVCCKKDLFDSDTKFDSGTGWPSFWQAISNNVKTQSDTSYGMIRTEVMCRNCGSHLGHIFDDGPNPTGLRYCINSASLKLEESEPNKGNIEVT